MQRKLFFIAVLALLAITVLCTGCCINSSCYAPRPRKDSQYCDMAINVIVRQPLSFYYGEYAELIIEGPQNYFKKQMVPMEIGMQVLTFRSVPAGRYCFTMSYAGMVVSKCGVLCCFCDNEWKAQCMYNLKDQLKAKRIPRYNYDNVPDWGYASPACGYPEPCTVIASFVIPDDAFKYDQ